MRCPYKYRYELAEWYKKYFNKSPANKSKNQLYAIWYAQRK